MAEQTGVQPAQQLAPKAATSLSTIKENGTSSAEESPAKDPYAKLPAPLRGFMSMPAARQASLILTLAAAVALILFVLLWSQKPTMVPLFSGLDQKDGSEIITALQTAVIPFEIESSTGTIMVESGRLHEARLKLASQGLPKGTGMGMEILAQEQGFGTSEFIQNARYHHALEAELARTINTLQNVKSSRVHLALPKQSVFVRNRTEPSASVVVNLYPGRLLDSGQIASIVHLVASSVPLLKAENVTVVDQSGRLLSDGTNRTQLAMSAKQYAYTRQLESDYAKRVEKLLSAIVGTGKVKAEVNAEVNFDEVESTRENYDPEKSVVRSEQSTESRRYGPQQPGGVPGALSNQPPEEPRFSEDLGIGQDGNAVNEPLSSSRNAVRNYEVDKVISHTRRAGGVVERLTVAVLVDDLEVPGGAEGQTVRKPLTEEELARMTTLVKEAIGFDDQRGDRVNIINASFTQEQALDELPAPAIWEQPWFIPALKQAGAVLLVLYLIFGVIRPAIRNLSSYTSPELALAAQGAAGGNPALGGKPGEEGVEGELESDRVSLSGQGGDGPLPLPSDYDKRIEFAKAMVDKDPRRVAKVVKEWVNDGG